MNSVLSPDQLALYDQLTRQGYSQHEAIMAVQQEAKEGPEPGVSDLLTSLGILGGTGLVGAGAWRAMQGRRGAQVPGEAVVPGGSGPGPEAGTPSATQPQSPTGGGPAPAPMVADTTAAEPVTALVGPPPEPDPREQLSVVSPGGAPQPVGPQEPERVGGARQFWPVSLDIPGEITPAEVVEVLSQQEVANDDLRPRPGERYRPLRAGDAGGRPSVTFPGYFRGSYAVRDLHGYDAQAPGLPLSAIGLIKPEDAAKLIAMGDTGINVLKSALESNIPNLSQDVATRKKQIDQIVGDYRKMLLQPVPQSLAALGKIPNIAAAEKARRRGKTIEELVGPVSREAPGMSGTTTNEGLALSRTKGAKQSRSDYTPPEETQTGKAEHYKYIPRLDEKGRQMFGFGGQPLLQRVVRPGFTGRGALLEVGLGGLESDPYQERKELPYLPFGPNSDIFDAYESGGVRSIRADLAKRNTWKGEKLGFTRKKEMDPRATNVFYRNPSNGMTTFYEPGLGEKLMESIQMKRRMGEWGKGTLHENFEGMRLSDIHEYPIDNVDFYLRPGEWVKTNDEGGAAASFSKERWNEVVHPGGFLTLADILQNQIDREAARPRYLVDEDMGLQGIGSNSLREPIGGGKAAQQGARSFMSRGVSEQAPPQEYYYFDKKSNQRIRVQQAYNQYETGTTAGARNAARQVKAVEELARTGMFDAEENRSLQEYKGLQREGKEGYMRKVAENWNTDVRSVERELARMGRPVVRPSGPEGPRLRGPEEPAYQNTSAPGWGTPGAKNATESFVSSFTAYRPTSELLLKARIREGSERSMRDAADSLMGLTPAALGEFGSHMKNLPKEEQLSVVGEGFAAAVHDLEVLHRKHPEIVQPLFESGYGSVTIEGFAREYTRKIAIARSLRASDQPNFIVSADALGRMALEARDDQGLDNDDVAAVLARKAQKAKTPMHAVFLLDNLVSEGAAAEDYNPTRIASEIIAKVIDLDDDELHINREVVDSPKNVTLSFGSEQFIERDKEAGAYNRGLAPVEMDIDKSLIKIGDERIPGKILREEQFAPGLNAYLAARRGNAESMSRNNALSRSERERFAEIAKSTEQDIQYIQSKAEVLARVGKKLENGVVPGPGGLGGTQIGRKIALSAVDDFSSATARQKVVLGAMQGDPGGARSLETVFGGGEDDGGLALDRQQDVAREQSLLTGQDAVVGDDDLAVVDSQEAGGGAVAAKGQILSADGRLLDPIDFGDQTYKQAQGPIKFKNLHTGPELTPGERGSREGINAILAERNRRGKIEKLAYLIERQINRSLPSPPPGPSPFQHGVSLVTDASAGHVIRSDRGALYNAPKPKPGEMAKPIGGGLIDRENAEARLAEASSLQYTDSRYTDKTRTAWTRPTYQVAQAFSAPSGDKAYPALASRPHQYSGYMGEGGRVVVQSDLGRSHIDLSRGRRDPVEISVVPQAPRIYTGTRPVVSGINERGQRSFTHEPTPASERQPVPTAPAPAFPPSSIRPVSAPIETTGRSGQLQVPSGGGFRRPPVGYSNMTEEEKGELVRAELERRSPAAPRHHGFSEEDLQGLEAASAGPMVQEEKSWNIVLNEARRREAANTLPGVAPGAMGAVQRETTRLRRG